MNKRINLGVYLVELRRLYNPEKIKKKLDKLPVSILQMKKIDKRAYNLILRKKAIILNNKNSFHSGLTFKQYIKSYFNLSYKKYIKIIKKGCSECDSKKHIHLHHIIPKSKGGSNELSNLTPLCSVCHAKKHPHMMKPTN